VAVIPAPDADGVAADATITVSFNRPVVPLLSTEQLADLPSPLTFEPEIEGAGEWINTSIFMFTPGKPLSGGTTYTVSVPAGLADAIGATLDETPAGGQNAGPEICVALPGPVECDARNADPDPPSQPGCASTEAFMRCIARRGRKITGPMIIAP
jgi:hypothetical protein